MREVELRHVLLVRALEDADAEGVLIPAADRLAASRDAKRKLEATGASQDALLAARAQALLPRIVARHAFVETILALVGGPRWMRSVLIVLAILAGVALSALDGTQRINILSFPLLGLVLWNLTVYVLVAIAALRGSAPRPKSRWLARLLAHITVSQASRLVARSRAFDAPLSEALSRFTRDWYGAAKPLLVLRATRMLHLCAAGVGIGLITGLYLRGIAFDYRAGWDSTFLDPPQVRALLSILYEPALTLTGITLPDAGHLASIRWRNGGDGESAARWIHLLAATAAVFVVAPRLLMALAATVRIRRLSRAAPVPPELASYYRAVFAASGAGERIVARVLPYAYQPTPNTLARLRNLLTAEHAGTIAVEVQPVVHYGEEEAFLTQLRERNGTAPDVLVLLTTLAATPEDENHGALIAELRDWAAATSPRTPVMVVVDEGPYARRMSSEGGAVNRVEERRSVWREFISARGLEPRVADLSG